MNAVEPLSSILINYFNVELFWHDFPGGIKRFLESNHEKAALFKWQFAQAITDNIISPEQYFKLTNHYFGNEIELNLWLRKLWGELYPDEEIPGDS